MLAMIFILLGACLVFGSALVLLSTAKKPKIPKNFKPHTEDENDPSEW